MTENSLLSDQDDIFYDSSDFNKNKHEVAKEKINNFSEILISQAELTENITKNITEFNDYLKPISEKILIMNQQDDFYKLASFVHFNKNINEIGERIDSFNQKFITAKKDLYECINNYRNVVQLIEKLHSDLIEESKFYKNSLAIIAYNKMRIQDMKNKVLHIDSSIETLENFKSSTLYHLRESVSLGLVNKDVEVLIKENLERLDKEINHNEKSYKFKKTVSLTVLFMAFYNFIAYKFPISYTSEKKIYASPAFSDNDQNFSPPLQSAIDDIFSLMGDIFNIGCIAVGTFMLLFSILRLSSSLQSQSENSEEDIVVGFMMLVLSAAPFFIPIIFNDIFDSNDEKVYQGTKIFNHTIEFYNLGISGSLILLLITMGVTLSAFYSKSKFKKTLNYKLDIFKLID